MYKNIEHQLETQFQNDFVESSDASMMWDSIEKKVNLKKTWRSRNKIFLCLGILALFSIAGTVYAIDVLRPVIFPAIEFQSKTSPVDEDKDISNITLPTIPTYSSIKERMLNSIDNFNTVQGTFREIFSPIHLDQTIEFNVSEGNSPGSYVKVTDNLTEHTTEETSSDGKSLLTLYNKNQKFMKADTTKTITDKIKGPRVVKAETGETAYIYRTDPAFSNQATEVILPQAYAFWLNDETKNYKVTGEDILLDRKVTLIEGTHDVNLAKKHNATQFKMWVDSETGVLLKLIESNTKGEVTNSIEVSSITFNQNIDRSKFSTEPPKGYTDIHTQ
jgi:outer membrane lipoprotein-sorting protein